ncbi:MAG: hypothetical protein U0350_17915 [Caldilineaceae bacterium]
MLLLHTQNDAHSRYSAYLAEILRLEGFADFAELDIEEIKAKTLTQQDLVILPRLSTRAAEAELFYNYVAQGGHLLAFLPDAHLAQRFGVTANWRGIDNGWLHPQGVELVLQGLCVAPVQIVVPAAGWAIAADAQVTVLAEIRAGKQAETGQPGIVWCNVGQGSAVFFAYDLPHAIARLRQGNPNHADLAFAGLDGIFRPSELFVGQLDVEQMLLPQADLQTALLARLIETLAPRPRLWYYPAAEQHSAVIMTSDDDWSTVEQFEALLAGLRKRQAHDTFYIVPETKISPALMDQWAAEGHTFSVHPALDADVRSGLATNEPQNKLVIEMLQANVARHIRDYGHRPRTIRQHAVRWLGYVEAARELVDLGVEMELNYISVHPFSLGYMAGSGRPLRFVDTDGAIINCYQQPTLWTEEVLIHPHFVFSFKWTVERALAETDKIIERAAREFYTPIIFNSHPVSFATYSSPLIEGCWDKALAEGMKILSADEWLAWTKARDRVRIEPQADGWIIYTPYAMASLTLLLPEESTSQAEKATVSRQVLWGRTYKALTLTDLAAGERRRITW